MVKVLLISGYKSFELNIFNENDEKVKFIKQAIKKELYTYIDEGLEWVIISGQLGTELWAAEVVFDLQLEGYEQLKLAIITPFLHQEENWKEERREWYESIVLQADYVNSITKRRYENPWQYRLKDQFLIENSDGLLLFYDQDMEGSPKYLYEKAIRYQETNEYEIRLINFYDLQTIVEEEYNKNHFFE